MSSNLWQHLFAVCISIKSDYRSNYLFVAHKPETASLLDVLPPWPYYILIIELLAAVFVLLFYSPFAILNKKTANK